MSADTNNKGYWLRSGLLSLIQNFSGVFFGFASFYLLVRVLNKDEYGSWVLFMAVVTILEAVRTGLIQTALIRHISGNARDEHAEIVGGAIVLSAVTTLICILANTFLAGYLATLWSTPELRQLFLLYNIVFLISGVLNILNCIEQANLSFKGNFAAGLIRQGFLFLFVGFAYVTNYTISLQELVWVLGFNVTLATIFAYHFAKPYLTAAFNKVRYWVKQLLNFGKYGFGTFVSSLLSGTIDQMMLGAMLSPAASGAFNIAVRITNLIDIPTNAMATIVFPQSAKRMASDGESAVKYLYEKSVGITLGILLPGILFLYFFAEWVITLLAGGQYQDSIPLLKITLLYALLIPFGRQFGTILDSIGKPKITFSVVLLTTVLNLVLNYFLIRSIGVMGAAYATLISNFIGFLLGQLVLKHFIGVKLGNVFIYMKEFYVTFFKSYLKFGIDFIFKNKKK